MTWWTSSTNAAVQHDSSKQLRFGVEGSKVGVYCMEDAEGDMVGVLHNKRCAQQVCSKRPRFGVAGSKVGVHGKEHAEDGMVNVS